MADAHIDPKIDLSIDTLAKACAGDIKKLPKFIVHDDASWPWFSKVRPAKGGIHIRRSTFNRVVVPQIPVRPGMWVRPDAQEYFIDLKPHHLQASEDQSLVQPGGTNHVAARRVTMADAAGLLPDEADYGKTDMERSVREQVDPDDLERVKADGERRGVRSTALDGGDTEAGLAVGPDGQ